MCQPKSEGGKRCLKHAKLSNFSERVVKVKTGADDAIINATMRELNKEGKNLPEVSAEDAKNFIEVKRFATEFDPELDAHERKIQLNQLEKAKVEVENGVAGGHMHAWKNLLARVGDKLKQLKKPLLGLSMAGVLAVSISGCAGVTPDKGENGHPTPSHTSSQTVDTTEYGDVIAYKKVTDSKGTYEQTTIAPDAEILKYNAAIVDGSAGAAGFDEARITSAQAYVAKFVSEQTLDSIALDNDAQGWSKWKKDVSTEYVEPSQTTAILDEPDTKYDRSIVILNDPDNSFPDTIRDGKPRLTSSKSTLTKITGSTDNVVGNYLYLEGNSTVEYRVNDAAAQKNLLELNKGVTKEQLKEAHPEFFDGKENQLEVKVSWSYAVIPYDKDWKIGGYNNSFATGLK